MIGLILLLLAPEEPDELLALQEAMRAAVERVSPSVVTITTRGGIRKIDAPEGGRMTTPERPRDGGRRKDPDEKPEKEDAPPGGRTPRFKNEWEKMLALPGFQKAEGPTTGVVLSPDGHIVTSAWNFESRPNVIIVTLSTGESKPARLLGVDRAAGLALLKIEAQGLPVPAFLDPREVRIGAWAFAVGRALSPRADVKQGVISAKNRADGTALQTDAAVSPSNYGGPLVDVEGRVYGILVPLGARGDEANPNWYDSGIGFAVPVPEPTRLVERLGQEGAVLLPAMLGVGIDDDRAEPGAKITEVAPDQAAAKAGLKAGDIILSADGEAIPSAFALRFAIGRRRAGDTMKLLLEREGNRIEIVVTLGARQQGEEEGREKLPEAPVPEEEEEE